MFEFNKFNFVLERKASKLAECPSPDGSDIPRFLAWIQRTAGIASNKNDYLYEKNFWNFIRFIIICYLSSKDKLC